MYLQCLRHSARNGLLPSLRSALASHDGWGDDGLLERQCRDKQSDVEMVETP